jgi:predicted transcriptional regulator
MHTTDVLVAFVNEALDRKQAELGLTDEKFAAELGIDYTTLYRVRKGRSWPKSLKAVLRVVMPAPQDKLAA